MKMILSLMLAAAFLGGNVFAATLENAKNDSGVKFSEANIKANKGAAVRLNGDFRSAPKAEATALPAKGKFEVPALKSSDNPGDVKADNEKGWKTAKITAAVIGGIGGGRHNAVRGYRLCCSQRRRGHIRTCNYWNRGRGCRLLRRGSRRGMDSRPCFSKR